MKKTITIIIYHFRVINSIIIKFSNVSIEKDYNDKKILKKLFLETIQLTYNKRRTKR